MKTILALLTLVGAQAFAQSIIATPSQVKYLLGTTTQANQVLQTDANRNIVQASGLAGVTSGANACAGCVGEYMSVNAAAVNVNSGAIIPVTTMTLTPGDWDVGGTVTFQTGVTAAVTTLTAALSTSNGSFDTTSVGNLTQLYGVWNGSTQQWLPAGSRRVNVSASTPIYLLGQYSGTTFGTNNTILSSSYIWARRAR